MNAESILSIKLFESKLPVSLPEAERKYFIGHFVVLRTMGVPGDAEKEFQLLETFILKQAWYRAYTLHVERALRDTEPFTSYERWEKVTKILETSRLHVKDQEKIFVEAASFDEANTVFDKPSDMTHDECQSLSVLKAVDTEGNPVVVSCWKPTQEELDEIMKTKRVWCIFYGVGIPPHCLSGTKPF